MNNNENKNLLPDAYSSPEMLKKMLASLRSREKQNAAPAQQNTAPDEDVEQVYGEPEQVPEFNYEDVKDNNPEFMNPPMLAQIQQWEDSYVPDEEQGAEESQETPNEETNETEA